tara:strand:- start:404 stop:745 length:342 start_codon:yes stop_codon:yes gene_type:complete
MWITKALDILTPKAGFSVHEDNINKIEWFSEDIERPSNDTILSKVSELKSAEPMRLLRIERDRLLAESDWRDLPSYPGSNQEAWRTYRKALRDFPANTEDASNPTWPTAPETD